MFTLTIFRKHYRTIKYHNHHWRSHIRANARAIGLSPVGAAPYNLTTHRPLAAPPVLKRHFAGQFCAAFLAMHAVLVESQLRVDAADVQVGAAEAAHLFHGDLERPTERVQLGQTERVLG